MVTMESRDIIPCRQYRGIVNDYFFLAVIGTPNRKNPQVVDSVLNRSFSIRHQKRLDPGRFLDILRSPIHFQWNDPNKQAQPTLTMRKTSILQHLDIPGNFKKSGCGAFFFDPFRGRGTAVALRKVIARGKNLKLDTKRRHGHVEQDHELRARRGRGFCG